MVGVSGGLVANMGVELPQERKISGHAREKNPFHRKSLFGESQKSLTILVAVYTLE